MLVEFVGNMLVPGILSGGIETFSFSNLTFVITNSSSPNLTEEQG